MANQTNISGYFKKLPLQSRNIGLNNVYNIPAERVEYFSIANQYVVEHLQTTELGDRNSGVTSTTTSSISRDTENAETRGKIRKRGTYLKLSNELRAKIGKYAAENGNIGAVRKFSTSEIRLNESTVRGLKKAYLLKAKEVGPENVTSLAHANRGRPLLLGNELDNKVKVYITALREAGGIVNRSIVICAAKGIVQHSDPTLLSENGGHIVFSKKWAESFLSRMNMVRKKGTKAARKLPLNFEDDRRDFLTNIRREVEEGSIPGELIVNIDQTGIKMVPCGDWTLAQKGTKQVSILGLDDKREITGLFGITYSGTLLPSQLIYAGKTKKCHPNINFPADFNITHTENHWSNEQSMIEYVDKVLAPYFRGIRRTLNLANNHPALLVLDVFAAHRTQSFLKRLEDNNIRVRFVPPGCTGELQPLDVAVNETFKRKMKDKFSSYYAQQVQTSLENGENVANIRINLSTSFIKPIHARWLVSVLHQLSREHEVIKSGWAKAGITDAIDEIVPLVATNQPAERMGIFEALMLKQ